MTKNASQKQVFYLWNELDESIQTLEYIEPESLYSSLIGLENIEDEKDVAQYILTQEKKHNLSTINLLTNEDRKIIFEAIKRDTYSLPFLLLFYTPLNLKEVSSLTWGNIQGNVIVLPSKYFFRRVPIPQNLSLILNEYKKILNRYYCTNKDNYVFPSTSTYDSYNHLSESFLERRFIILSKSIGMYHYLTQSSIRYTLLYNMVNKGIPVRNIIQIFDICSYILHVLLISSNKSIQQLNYVEPASLYTSFVNVTDNISDKNYLKKIKDKKIYILSRVEKERLFTAIKENDYALIFLIWLYTPLSLEKVLSLTWSTIRRNSIVMQSRDPRESLMSIPLPEGLSNILEEYRATQKKYFEFTNIDYIFPLSSDINRHLTDACIFNDRKRIFDCMGIPNITALSVKYTFFRDLIDAGVVSTKFFKVFKSSRKIFNIDKKKMHSHKEQNIRRTHKSRDTIQNLKDDIKLLEYVEPSSLYSSFVDREILDNPDSLKGSILKEENGIYILHKNEKKRIFEAIRENAYALPLLIFFYTPLLLEEVIALTWENIKENSIRFPADEPSVSIPIPQSLSNIMCRYKNIMSQHRETRPHDYIFVSNRYNNHISFVFISDILMKILKETVMRKGVNIISLKHTLLYDLIDARVPSKEIAKMFKITSNLSPDLMKKVLDLKYREPASLYAQNINTDINLMNLTYHNKACSKLGGLSSQYKSILSSKQKIMAFEIMKLSNDPLHMLLGFYTGISKHKLHVLTWNDVDFEKNMIFKYFHVPKEILQILKSTKGNISNTSELVFPHNRVGKNGHASNKLVYISSVDYNVFRHTIIYDLLECGTPIKKIAQLSPFIKYSITENNYFLNLRPRYSPRQRTSGVASNGNRNARGYLLPDTHNTFNYSINANNIESILDHLLELKSAAERNFNAMLLYNDILLLIEQLPKRNKNFLLKVYIGDISPEEYFHTENAKEMTTILLKDTIEKLFRMLSGRKDENAIAC